MTTSVTRAGTTPSQRRSQRIFLCVGIIVLGKKANGATFSERTKTEVVSAHGALIVLQEPVCAGQELIVRNIPTNEEIVCTVVDCNPGQTGVAEVGIQFKHSSPRFWRVAFPPSDWSTRSPEAKRFNIHNANLPKPVK